MGNLNSMAVISPRREDSIDPSGMGNEGDEPLEFLSPIDPGGNRIAGPDLVADLATVDSEVPIPLSDRFPSNVPTLSPEPSRSGDPALSELRTGNSFHERVFAKYQEWVSSSGESRAAIYRPASFNGNWESVPPEEYILHRLSILGIPENMRADDIGKILVDYRTEILTPERLNILQDAYKALNADLTRYGLSAGGFDPNKIVFIQEQRISEIAGQSHDVLGYTLKGDFGEILIPHDSEELNSDPNQLFDVIVHELGHQVRLRNDLDIDASMVLEEGIVQAKARDVEFATSRTSRRTEEVYAFEAQVATELAASLGVPELFKLPHSKIRELMGIRYGIAGAMTDPYDDLIYDMLEYLKLSEVFQTEIKTTEDISGERIKEMQIQLKIQRQGFNQRWQFSMK